MMINLKVEAAKIIYIPHDVRPICAEQTAEVVEQAGYKIEMPPEEYFGTTRHFGEPEKIIEWLETKAESADAAIISTDSILYSGLIPSRKHNETEAAIEERIERIRKLREKNSSLRIYLFSSLMRTPKEGVEGFDEEPEYYVEYGRKIFEITMLMDKQEISKLSGSEQERLEQLQKNIPEWVMKDYFDRRMKNLTATKKFIEMTSQGLVNYLLVGRDDNSPLCQTHKENRELIKYAEEFHLQKDKFQSLVGIDEFGLLILTRAINDLNEYEPLINVKYNRGKGGGTIPAYSDETIEESIKNEIEIAGGKMIDDETKADLILCVNTDVKGRTFHSHNSLPDNVNYVDEKKLIEGAKIFSEMINELIQKNYPIAIADITFANGSDNYLMKNLFERGLLFKIQSYSGWNTASNSTGFALGTGILSNQMKNSAKDKLLVRRYLDDWIYQANVRTLIGEQLYNTREGGRSYYKLDEKTSAVEERVTELMKIEAQKKLPPFDYLKDFKVKLPWRRMFECEIKFNS